MIINEALIERLLNEHESDTLDFKERQYAFPRGSDFEKSELLKDILAFANTARKTDAFILIGVKEVKGGVSIPVGINDSIDDASLQQFVNSKTQRSVMFSYHERSFQGVMLGVFQISIQDRQTYLLMDYGKLKKNIVYIREGTSTKEASPDEILGWGRDENDPLMTDRARKLLEYLVREADGHMDSMPTSNEMVAALGVNLSECKEAIEELESLGFVTPIGDAGSPIGYGRARLGAAAFVKFVSRFMPDLDIVIEIKRTLGAFPESGDYVSSESVLQATNIPLVRLQLLIDYLRDAEMIDASPCWLGDGKLGFAHGRLLPLGKRALRGLDPLPNLEVMIR